VYSPISRFYIEKPDEAAACRSIYIVVTRGFANIMRAKTLP
jgi:hypothetical protein